jgi:lipoprotein-anchoring transpeptidase ErfK/SrfK
MASETVSGRSRALTVVVAVAGVVAALSAGAAPAGAVDRPVIAPRQTLATLLTRHTALSAPASGASVVAVVAARRPITEVRTVLPVLDQAAASDGSHWLRVRLPGRPNGRTGWIRETDTVRSLTRWHLVVDTSSRRVRAYRDGRLARSFAAVVGKPSTPTPPGEAFVEEAIQLRAGAAGAPYALALSARSTVLQEFAGGPGQIALHGLRNIGGVLGTAASHGCVRVATATMSWLITRIGPGTPVTITR